LAADPFGLGQVAGLVKLPGQLEILCCGCHASIKAPAKYIGNKSSSGNGEFSYPTAVKKGVGRTDTEKVP
jgi:hypothetical protein